MAIYRSFCSSVIQTLIPFLILLHISQGQYQFDEKTCGVLYSEEDFGGGEFTFHDGDQSADLGEDHGHGHSEHGWNVTRSVRVSPGCEMTLYNETYFDGAILPLGEGQVENLPFENVSSLSCTCEKECRCEDIFMKKTTCARGYLAGGCKTCNSMYTDLFNRSDGIAFEFYGKIEALRLRKGCKLHTYADESYHGDLITYEEETVEGIIGPFWSFECECNDTQYVPRVKPPRPATFPPLIDIPEKLDDILKLLSNKTYSDHPGLQSARNSFIKKRSSRNAYILLLGTTGAGKSSAVNILFDNPDVTKVGDYNSTTTDIHEFRIPVEVDEFGIANSELRVIDTPGLGDTRGLEQDAKFLATLDNFLSTHEELNNRIPNVVLIFHKFNDNRFNGPGSSFVRMIRGFDSFRGRLIDDKYSNVIFVLSHFCSETQQKTRRPQARLMAFKDVIENYSLFPKPILLSVAENKAGEQNLPMINGYHKLPNNEYYPRNLFEKMELVTQKGGDMVGLGVFRTAFRDSDDFNVSATTFKLINGNSEKIQEYFNILIGGVIDVTETKMSAHLKTIWDTEIDASLRKQFPESLFYLQKSLNLRSINAIEDIPKTSVDILALLTSLKHDEATRQLVEKALGIKAPLFPHATIAGYSYNVFKDTHLPTSPFVMGDTQQSDIGFLLPRSLTCKLDPKSKDHLEILGNREEYIQQRLKSLGISGTIPESNFTGQIKPGHNIKGIALLNNSCSLSAVREFRQFELVINDRLDLTPEFQRIVQGLPIFNGSDHENVEKWNHFFNEYGTHVVHTVYGGGSIEIRVDSDKPFSAKTAKALFDLIKFAEDLQFLTPDTNEGEADDNSTTPILQEGLTHSLNFVGGDSAFHTNDLTKMSIERAGNLLENWKKSLKFNPAILITDMKLVPISQIARKLGQNYTTEIDRATSLKFNSELKYVPPKITPNVGPGASRDHTPFMTEILRLQQDSNQRMHEMMLEMRRIEQKNEERRQIMDERRMEWERNKTTLEWDYKLKQLELEKEVEAEKREFEIDLEEKRGLAEERKMNLTHAHQTKERIANEAEQRRREEAARLATSTIATTTTKKSGCLKSGARILMGDMSEKLVEELEAGDILLDRDLQPTRLLGISHEFLRDQPVYGFDNESFFFTAGHMFHGESGGKKGTQLFTLSTEILFRDSPLMEYLNVTEMSSVDDLKILHFAKERRRVAGEKCEVFEDPLEHPPETLIYFLHVDSPSETYIANGYVCRHEVPPLEHWPNTMSLLFRLTDTPIFKEVCGLPYTLETDGILREKSSELATLVQKFLEEDGSNWEIDEGKDSGELMSLDGADVENYLSNIFSSPTVVSVGSNLYAKVGRVVAPYLDGDKAQGHQVAKYQHLLFHFIRQQMEIMVAESV